MADDPAAPLPQVDLLHGSTITVELDVVGATITALNVHGFEGAAGEVREVPLIGGLLPSTAEV